MQKRSKSRRWRSKKREKLEEVEDEMGEDEEMETLHWSETEGWATRGRVLRVIQHPPHCGPPQRAH